MPSHPHDRLFKGVFSDPIQASAWLRDHAPEVAAHVDLGSLVLRPGSFVDEGLSERHGDLLFTARFRSGEPLLLYLLFEHQSTVDPRMAFRVLRYLVRIWDRALDDDAKEDGLPPILPVVVYHGEVPWSAPVELGSLIRTPPSAYSALAPFLPRLTFLLQDLSVAEEAELRGEALGRMALLLLKHARTGHLAERLPRWLDTLEEMMGSSGLRALELVMRYILHVDKRPPDPEVLSQIRDRVGARELEGVMGYIDQVREEALQQGLERGLQQGLERGLQQGLQKGLQKGEEQLRGSLLRQLEQRFGPLSGGAIARVEGADISTLGGWMDRLLGAPSVEALLGEEGG